MKLERKQRWGGGFSPPLLIQDSPEFDMKKEDKLY